MLILMYKGIYKDSEGLGVDFKNAAGDPLCVCVWGGLG